MRLWESCGFLNTYWGKFWDVMHPHNYSTIQQCLGYFGGSFSATLSLKPQLRLTGLREYQHVE